MDHVTGLRFLTGLNSGTIVLGAWWVPSEPFNYGRGVHPSAVGFRIDVHLVEAAQRSGLRTLLKEQALPELRELIQYGAQADPVSSWRRTEHCRYWRFEDGELSARDER